MVPLKVIIPGVAGVIVLSALLNSCTVVQPYERGVKITLGNMDKTPIQPGPHVLIPFFQSITTLDTRIKNYQVEEEAASHDLQDVKSTVSTNYHINPEDVPWVYQHLGNEEHLEETVISPAISNAVKAITAEYDASDLINKRTEVKNLIEVSTQTALQQFNIVVDAVNITNFSFSTTYTQAIENKQAAQQRALQATYELQQITTEAQQQVVKADAQAKANDVKQKSITPQILIQEFLDKWNGVLPQYVSSSGLPNVMTSLTGVLPTTYGSVPLTSK